MNIEQIGQRMLPTTIDAASAAVDTTQERLDAAFKALSSPQRREILRILSETTPDAGKTCCGPDEVCGCKLSDQLGLAASTISHHMNILRDAGLVDARKDGWWVYYTLRRDALAAVRAELDRL